MKKCQRKREMAANINEVYFLCDMVPAKISITFADD